MSPVGAGAPAARSTFGQRLHSAMARRGPLCAGIDPHPELMRRWGLDDTPSGLERFALAAVEAVSPVVAAVKPQSAFFERHGARGIAVLERVVAAARSAGTLVVLDVKRGDIGSTAQAYADAYLDARSPLAADAITASPYLGMGSLEPVVDTALAQDAGVFVLALTSNPEGRQVQAAVTESGRTVAGTVLASVAARNVGAAPLGSIGVVVGATIGTTEEDLAVGGPLLVPGLGVQGGTAGGVRAAFGDNSRNVLGASSRAILAAGPDQAALRAAAERTSAELAQALRPGLGL